MRNDNRNYNYEDFPSEKRVEYVAITSLLAPGSKVIDLACGNGALMEMMIAEKGCTCEGVELSPSGVQVAVKRGLSVREGRIDEKLPYADGEFDVAVCNVTIQMVMYPEQLLAEMKRISRKQIISFPNFAYFRNRLDLLLYGRMPKPMLFGYQWYNTGHIHQLSIRDFGELLAHTGGMRITRTLYVPVGYKIIDGLGSIMPGWFRKEVILETENI
ncbi:methionine biosynthesis protein MetW [Chitinophaga sp. MM2321]|uniref:methionine biosynthesis protein MetW n=1 Tax=Chitinophaga sp. MM2321 TaxID=3137178 RepID=UPI0032D583EE